MNQLSNMDKCELVEEVKRLRCEVNDQAETIKVYSQLVDGLSVQRGKLAGERLNLASELRELGNAVSDATGDMEDNFKAQGYWEAADFVELIK